MNPVEIFQFFVIAVCLIAAIVSFAAYRSSSVGGPESINAGRLVKAVVYLVIAGWVIDLISRADPQQHALLIPIFLLALVDLGQGLSRIADSVGVGPWMTARHARHDS
jgi:hypothetical protein